MSFPINILQFLGSHLVFSTYKFCLSNRSFLPLFLQWPLKKTQCLIAGCSKELNKDGSCQRPVICAYARAITWFKLLFLSFFFFFKDDDEIGKRLTSLIPTSWISDPFLTHLFYSAMTKKCKDLPFRATAWKVFSGWSHSYLEWIHVFYNVVSHDVSGCLFFNTLRHITY